MLKFPDALQERIDSGELFFWDADEAINFESQLQNEAMKGKRTFSGVIAGQTMFAMMRCPTT